MARDIAVLHRLSIGVVVVHGGGPQLDAMTQRLGLSVERVAGRRITSPAVLDAAKMVFRGQLSLDLVSALVREGERAVGLSGVDGGLIQAVRRPEALVTDDAGERQSVDFGEVGEGHLRFSFATSKRTIDTALERLARVLPELEREHRGAGP